jgi:hypothetical protein
MGYYGADTEHVQTVGRSVFNLEPEATSAVNGVLNSYSDAAGAVHHPMVSGALNSYRDTHQRAHLAFPEAVKGLGSNTAHGGAAIADGGNEATSVMRANLGTQETLVRDINPPISSD